MRTEARRRCRLAAALRPREDDAPTLDLLFNLDEHGHEYAADLLDLAAKS